MKKKINVNKILNDIKKQKKIEDFGIIEFNLISENYKPSKQRIHIDNLLYTLSACIITSMLTTLAILWK